MAVADIQEYVKLIPAVNRAPQHAVWLTYDAEADTLYVNFKKPIHATDSEMTDEDVIVRYEGSLMGSGFAILTLCTVCKRKCTWGLSWSDFSSAHSLVSPVQKTYYPSPATRVDPARCV